MKRLYACPNCNSEHSGIPSAWDDGAGEDGMGLTAIFDCYECGQWFTEDEGFIGYEGQPDDNPNDDVPFTAPGDNNFDHEGNDRRVC